MSVVTSREYKHDIEQLTIQLVNKFGDVYKLL